MPDLDKRTRQEIAETAKHKLTGLYTPNWGTIDPGDPTKRVFASDDPGVQLIELFARLAELLIERLNRVPKKNFLSFLDLTGVERFPGAAAEAPVTFLVSQRAPLGGLVPAGTQIATTQTATTDAHVFETRRAFYATPARLQKIIALLPIDDRFVSLPAPDPAELVMVAPTTVFSDSEPALLDVDHVLYLGSKVLFGRDVATDIDVTLVLESGTFPTTSDVIVWQRYDETADNWVSVDAPTVDLSTAGEVTLTFNSLEEVGQCVIEGVEDYWLAADYVGPFDSTFQAPVISDATGVVRPPAQPLRQFDAAFFNSAPIDLSKPFRPFGGRPAYGDAFYFASQVAFGADVEAATITFSIRPQVHEELKEQFTGLDDNPTSIRTVARWQYLDVSGEWVDLASFDHEFQFAQTTGDVHSISHRAPAGSHAARGTFIGENGEATVEVRLDGFQDRIGLHKVNAVSPVSRWMRVLLASDEPYGNDGVITGAGVTTRFVGPLFISPTIEEVSIAFVPRQTPVPITNVKTLNNFAFRDHGAVQPFVAFAPFRSISSQQITDLRLFGDNPAVYFAFDSEFGAVPVSLFFDLAPPTSRLTSPLEGGNPNIAWEYWSAESGWSALDVEDETLDLTTSGTVGFVGPQDASPVGLAEHLTTRSEGDSEARWWFRARLAGGEYDHPPRITGIYLNTVGADNHLTLREDFPVGSSNGEPSQAFALVNRPVLDGELWVRETDAPGDEEIVELEKEHSQDSAERRGAGDVTQPVDVREPENVEREVWVRWRRVANFQSSSPRNRHYTLDSVAGIIGFGDGNNGLIPPVGRNNLTLRAFRTGGGEKANREAPAMAIKELKTSLPFIDTVFNVQAASAGASSWTFGQLEEFGPQILKNRGRPVTTEDYEWMVRQRFPQVARVRCLPTTAPLPGGGLGFKAGAVTVLVVPKSADRRPQPSQGLIRSIRDFLVNTALDNLALDIHVKGPNYVAVDVNAHLEPARPELASVVVRKATASLEDFLHPLTGGEKGSGYDFGRPVFLSEVQAVLERIEEVDHVVSAEFPGVPGEDEFIGRLASSGRHTIRV